MRAWVFVTVVAIATKATTTTTVIDPTTVSYCNFPSRQQEIPPLGPQPEAGDVSLIQVQTVIRHGARAPLLGYDFPTACSEEKFCTQKCGAFYRTDGTGAPYLWNCPSRDLISWSEDGPVGPIPSIAFTSYPASNPNPWLPGNCTTGYLVTKGYEQHKRNGEVIRAAYIERDALLGGDMQPDQMMITADSDQRTQASAQAVVSGMYPCNDSCADNRFNLNLIPRVDGRSYNGDSFVDFFTTTPYCGKPLEDVLENFKSSWESQTSSSPSPVLAEYSSLMLDGSPLPFDQSDDKLGRTGALQCGVQAVCAGHSVPVSNQSFHEAIQLYTDYAFQERTYVASVSPSTSVGDNHEATKAQLVIGALIQKIFESMEPSANSHRVPFVLWSSHGETVWTTLFAFGINITYYPPFASMINFELYKNTNNDMFVRVLFMGGDVTSNIPGCPASGKLCPWSAFHAQGQKTLDVVSALCKPPSNSSVVPKISTTSIPEHCKIVDHSDSDKYSGGVVIGSFAGGAFVSGIIVGLVMWWSSSTGSDTKYNELTTNQQPVNESQTDYNYASASQSKDSRAAFSNVAYEHLAE